MIEGIPLSLSASALLGLTVLLLLAGRIVPRVTLRDKQEEAERWRLAYEKEREARNISVKHARELLEHSRTTAAIIRGMADASEHIRKESDDALQEK